MRVSYDPEADALYVQFREIAPGSVETREFAAEVSADYGPDGKLSGIEVLGASSLLGSELERVVLEVAPSFRAKSA